MPQSHSAGMCRPTRRVRKPGTRCATRRRQTVGLPPASSDGQTYPAQHTQLPRTPSEHSIRSPTTSRCASSGTTHSAGLPALRLPQRRRPASPHRRTWPPLPAQCQAPSTSLGTSRLHARPPRRSSKCDTRQPTKRHGAHGQTSRTALIPAQTRTTRRATR